MVELTFAFYLTMKINLLESKAGAFAEIISDEIIIGSVDEALDLMANLGYQGVEKIILYEKNIHPDFFDLKTRLAGEILQKFSNYRMQLFIIGDFEKFTSKALNDFIYESNKGKTVAFVGSIEQVLGTF